MRLKKAISWLLSAAMVLSMTSLPAPVKAADTEADHQLESPQYIVSITGTDLVKALLQAEIQITFPDFRQWLICLRRDKILASKECCAWDISRNIASLIITNKLSQLLLLAGRKQSKQLFTDLSAGIF